MKIIPYLFYLYVLAIYNTILSDIISIYDVTIDLAAVMVGLIALYKSESVAVWFSLMAAFVVGTPRLELVPWEMVVLAISALIINRASNRINLEAVSSRLLMLAALILVHGTIMALLTSRGELVYMVYRMVLPVTAYSLLLGWLFFLFKDGHITWKKMKAIF
jgi:hypothetical protein